MGTIVRYGAAFLAVGVLALIVRVHFNEWTQRPNLPLVGPVATTSLAAASPYAASGYVDQTGMILMDNSHGYPSIPFLQYATADHGVATKQLIFPWSRGCSVYAGDLPCVAADEAQAYPQLPLGEQVRIRGLLKDDRILVYQID